MTKTVAPSWHPSIRYVWTRKQVQAWIDEHGFWCFYQGARYKINSKHVMAGRYDVWFTEG